MSRLVADDMAVAVAPDDSFLHHDAADLLVAMPMPGHGRFRRHDRHRSGQHSGSGQGKEEFLHGNSHSSAPVPSSMQGVCIRRRLIRPQCRRRAIFRHVQRRMRRRNGISLPSAPPATSLTAVKSVFNRPTNTGWRRPVVSFDVSRGFSVALRGKPCQASKTGARGGRVSFARSHGVPGILF